MFGKFGSLFDLFRKGEEIANASAWKQGGITVAALSAFLLAIDSTLRAYGYDIPVTADQVKDIATGVIALVGVVLPAVTSARAGLLPPKQTPDSPVDSGMPAMAEEEKPS